MSDKPSYEELERKIETLNVKLHKSKSNIREIQALAKIGSWEWDLELQSLLWSEEIYHIFGLDPVSFKPSSKAFEATIHPDDLDDFLKKRDRMLNEKRMISIDYRIILPDGSIRYVQERTQQIINRQGVACRIIGTVQDITDRIQANITLKENEEKYYVLFENCLEALFLTAQDGSVFLTNKAACELLGMSESEIISCGRDGVVNLKDPRLPAALEERRKNGKFKGELTFKKKDGTIFPVEVSSSVFEDRYGNEKTCIFFHDITDRKRAEVALIESEAQFVKAESLNRMAGAIAHHFNNQLAVVIGNLELALEGVPQDAALFEDLTSAMQGAHKAAEVGGHMLTYLGQTTGTYIPLDLSETCRQRVSSLQASAPEEIALNVDLLTPGPVVRGNTVQIQQVLGNLITNACEAMKKQQGEIDVIVKTVPRADIPPMLYFPPDWKPENETYACLEIRDTGCGIEEKDLDKVFDPFFSNKFTGRGLGLAIVLGIVKAHGGAVAVDSEKVEGSSFKVYLPVAAELVSQKPDEMIRASDMKTGGTILLVEDEEMIRNMTTTMLTRMGFKVLEAIDGVDAVEIFQKHQDEIDVVVSDLTMPRMDGWETLAALRRIRPDLPVILASGHDESMALAGNHLESPQAFLHKPYKKSELKESLAKAMSGSNVE